VAGGHCLDAIETLRTCEMTALLVLQECRVPTACDARPATRAAARPAITNVLARGRVAAFRYGVPSHARPLWRWSHRAPSRPWQTGRSRPASHLKEAADERPIELGW